MDTTTLTKAETDTITITIDGVEVRTTKGKRILEAALDAGIYIPALCYYPDLRPLAELQPDRACRLCVVEVEGVTDPQLACTTPVADRMVVQTNTPRLQNARRNSLKLILSRHPHACLTCHRRERCKPGDICLRLVSVTEEQCIMCPQNGRCELQRVVDYVGVEEFMPYTPKK
ncbi:MAG: 2Fe-2S iron-sulfur cluster-binding protein, partial [Dehalococcoidia bacterium]